MEKVTLRFDLTPIIDQAARQVYGSDERSLLYQWLSRNAGQEQRVTVVVPVGRLQIICSSAELWKHKRSPKRPKTA